jgi:uncharacterized membrane protein YfcA
MLFLEIGLTIAAWRKGWRGMALLPMVAALLFGFLVGAAAGANGATAQSVLPFAFLGDLLCVVALIAMAKHAPRSVETSSPAETVPAGAVTTTEI